MILDCPGPTPVRTLNSERPKPILSPLHRVYHFLVCSLILIRFSQRLYTCKFISSCCRLEEPKKQHTPQVTHDVLCFAEIDLFYKPRQLLCQYMKSYSETYAANFSSSIPYLRPASRHSRCDSHRPGPACLVQFALSYYRSSPYYLTLRCFY